MHDFYAIVFAQDMLRVQAARHDFAIDFDRDATSGVAGFGEQAGDGGFRRALVGLSVEKYLHAGSVTSRNGGGMPCAGKSAVAVVVGVLAW